MSEVLTNGIKVPDKGSRSWYDDMRGDLIKLDALIGSASSVTVNPIITSGIEIASINVNGKSYSLYQQDGDIAVNIKPVTTNEELPVLLSKSSEENTDTVDMSVGVTVNPSTNTVTATNFVGNLNGNATTAASATKATQDASGNVITDTYAKVNNLALVATSGSYTDLTNKPTLPTKVSDLTNDSGFINNTDNCVHLTGNESIGGTKTFTKGVVYTNMSSYAYNDEITTNAYGGWFITDKNNSTLASLCMGFITGDNANDLRLTLKNKSGSTVGLKILEDGSVQSIISNKDLGASSKPWGNVYTTTITASILNIPQNAIVLAFCSSAVNNGSTVAGTALKVANGGTGGTFTATTETLTGTYRALNTVVANGVGMFVKIV